MTFYQTGRPIAIGVLLILALAACSGNRVSIKCADKFQSTAVDTMVSWEPIHALKVDLACRVVLKPGSQQEIQVSGPRDLVQHVLMYSVFSKGELSLSRKPGSWCVLKGTELTITATIPGLKRIQADSKAVLTTAGAIGIEPDDWFLQLDGGASAHLDLGDAASMDATLDGRSSLELEGSARQMLVHMDGRSALVATSFLAEAAEISMDGKSEAQLNVSKLLHVKKLENGTICYLGAAQVSTDTDPSSRVQHCH